LVFITDSSKIFKAGKRGLSRNPIGLEVDDIAQEGKYLRIVSGQRD
jgi:hypothetical protein